MKYQVSIRIVSHEAVYYGVPMEPGIHVLISLDLSRTCTNEGDSEQARICHRLSRSFCTTFPTYIPASRSHSPPPPPSLARVENDGEHTASSGDNPTTTTATTANLPPAPGAGEVRVKLRAAPCTPADLRTLDAAAASAAATAAAAATATADTDTTTTTTVGTEATSTAQRNHPPSPSLPPPLPPPPYRSFKFPFVGGSEGLWEVTAVGEGVSGLRSGDLAIPTSTGNPPGCLAAPETGTWRTTATLGEASLVRVPQEAERGADAAVVAHCSGSVATALRVLDDFVVPSGVGSGGGGGGGGEGGAEEGSLRAGDRVVFTGASSAVAQARCFFLYVPLCVVVLVVLVVLYYFYRIWFIFRTRASTFRLFVFFLQILF